MLKYDESRILGVYRKQYDDVERQKRKYAVGVARIPFRAIGPAAQAQTPTATSLCSSSTSNLFFCSEKPDKTYLTTNCGAECQILLEPSSVAATCASSLARTVRGWSQATTRRTLFFRYSLKLTNNHILNCLRQYVVYEFTLVALCRFRVAHVTSLPLSVSLYHAYNLCVFYVFYRSLISPSWIVVGMLDCFLRLCRVSSITRAEACLLSNRTN